MIRIFIIQVYMEGLEEVKNTFQTRKMSDEISRPSESRRSTPSGEYQNVQTNSI